MQFAAEMYGMEDIDLKERSEGMEAGRAEELGTPKEMIRGLNGQTEGSMD